MKLFINKISITGFKGYKESVSYNLGHKTQISGDNGIGKSSISEAIAWCLLGTDVWGNEKATTKLVNDNKPKVTEVVLDFLLNDEPQTIIRRKKGSTNEIYWNEKKSSTNDIAKEIFKVKDVFLSIFNPYYFPELTPKDAKQLLSDVLKPVGREEIFVELGDYLKEILLNNGFRLPETFITDTRANIKEHEDNIIFLEGKLEGSRPIEIGEKKEFNPTELTLLSLQLKEAEKDNSIDVKLAEIVPPYDYSQELSELESEELKAKIDYDMKMKSLLELHEINSKKNLKDRLLVKYNAKKTKLDTVLSNFVKCSNCGNEIDLTAKSKKELSEEIKEIQHEGLKLKDEIAQIEVENKEIEEKNNFIREKAQNEYNEQMVVIENNRTAITGSIETLKAKYEEERNQIIAAANSEELKDKIDFLKSKIALLEEEQREVNRFNSEIDAAIKYNEGLVKDTENTNREITNSKNKISQLKLALDACKQYNSIKLKKQSKQIKEHLDKVEIQFEEMNKEGELKDKFKINYEGKEFNKLSNAEKIKAGLEIANLLMNIQELYFPVFIDNAESINQIPELNTQMIIAKVTRENDIDIEVIE